MARLFISLYLVIIVGLHAINWGSETLWHKINNEESKSLLQQKQLLKVLAQHIDVNPDTLSAMDQKLTLLAFNDVAWLPEQAQALQRGEVITLYDSNQHLFLVVGLKNNSDLLQIGPIAPIQYPIFNKMLVLGLSYVLLAIVIAMWTRPIWRDLQQLTSLAQQINNHSHSSPLQPLVKSRSPIAPIVNSVNFMIMRIQGLIDEQKHLINALSHELRTPLSRMRFSVAMLASSDNNQQQEINQDLGEIEHLVDEMLSYSRIEHLASKQAFSNVEIHQLLQNQIEKHQRTSSKQLNLSVSEPIVCFCNGDLLERACQNLITNALRYAKQCVNVSAVRLEDKLVITVEDDGKGIPEKARETLFEPFKRLDKSRNKSQGGYGLGLAIVYKVCQWHQGNCAISDSALGGAKFTIKVPLKSQDI